MINRELIRLKVVQLVYSNYKNSGQTLKDAKEDLQKCLDASYELYNYLLLLIPELTSYARELYDTSVERAQALGLDEMPNPKFVNNRLAAQLCANTQLNAFMEKKENTKGETYIWNVADMEFRKLFKKITESKLYKDYMQSSEDSYEADKVFWIKAYKRFICENDDLLGFMEDENLYWNDDRYIIDSFVLKTLKQFEEANGEEQELLPKYKNVEDEEFAFKLFEKAILNRDEYEKLIAANTRNWTLSRLPVMDVVVMVTALAEIVTFPSIPLRITLNEFINIAKLYCRPQSTSYINGMLDNIAGQLSRDKVINKK